MKAQVIKSGSLLYRPAKDKYELVPDGKFAVGLIRNDSPGLVNGVDMVGKYFSDEIAAKNIVVVIDAFLPSNK